VLTTDQIAAYRKNGFVLVDGLVTPAEVAPALAAMEQLFYGKPFATWLRQDADRALPGSVPDGVVPMPDGRRSRWPTGDERLDRLIENDALLDVAAALLDDEPFFCAGIAFLRAGPTDTRFPELPHTGWHFDHCNNSLLPPSPDLRHDYVNVVVYLHDVDEAGAPTLLLPGTQLRAVDLAIGQLAVGNFLDGTFTDLRRLGELPAPVPAVGRAGSVLFYSSFLVHAAQPFRDRRLQRAQWTLSLGRRRHASWCRHDNPFGYEHRAVTRIALARTKTRVRTLLGWPPPGDPYYTAATLELLQRSYPGIDLRDYRR
jgi:hypothetical protein